MEPSKYLYRGVLRGLEGWEDWRGEGWGPWGIGEPGEAGARCRGAEASLVGT